MIQPMNPMAQSAALPQPMYGPSAPRDALVSALMAGINGPGPGGGGGGGGLGGLSPLALAALLKGNTPTGDPNNPLAIAPQGGLANAGNFT